jgi:hypothetical protein
MHLRQIFDRVAKRLGELQVGAATREGAMCQEILAQRDRIRRVEEAL